MTIFVELFVFLAIVAIATSTVHSEKKRKILQALWGGVALWIPLALRSWTCGQDLLYVDRGVGYIIQFQRMDSTPFLNAVFQDNGYEFGFNALFWFINNYISTNPQIMLAIVGALEIGLIGYTFYKKSPNIILSYIAFACLGLYLFSYSGLRQGLGFALTFFAFNFINEKVPWKFFALVFVAFSMHRSSVIFLPAYFFRNIYLSKLKCFWGLLGVFAFLPVLMPVIQYFSMLVYGKEKYASYEGGAYGLFFLFILMFIYSLAYVADNKDKEKKLMQVRVMTLIAVFLQSSGILSSGALARIAFNYSIFFCLLLPYTVSCARIAKRKTIAICIALLLLAFFFYVNKDGTMGIIPYRFFWEEYNIY